MDTLQISAGDTLTIEWAAGDTLELVDNAIFVMPVGTGGGGAVNSVNGQGGNVVLTATDVGADVAGAAQAVSDVLQPQITLNTDAVAMLTALLSALQSAKADVSYVNQQIATLVGTDTQTLAAIQAISDALADNEDLLSVLDQTVANRVRFDVSTQGLTALQKYNARTNIGAEESGTAALLISQITAASIGAATTAQLALKQDKLPTNGLDGQFLAHDFTFKTPVSGGGGDSSITWTAFTTLLTENAVSGFADGSSPLMIGKGTDGLIYVKGIVRNSSSLNAISSGTGSHLQLFHLPGTHHVKGFTTTGSTYTLHHIRYTDQNNAGSPNATNYFGRLLVYQGVQTFGVSTSMGVNGIIHIPPSVIGIALNP